MAAVITSELAPIAVLGRIHGRFGRFAMFLNGRFPPTAVDPARRMNVCFGVAATIG
jgi:hypothetical protein